MTKRFHHYWVFADPAGVKTPHQFCDDLLAPFGSTRLPALFHNDIFPEDGSGGWDSSGDIDERKFRHVLSRGDNTGKIPPDSWCWLNIENPEHNVYEAVDEYPWIVPQQKGIDFFHRVLDVAKDERPDVKFGLFGQVPYAGYQFTLNPRLREARERLYVACRPLAEELGFLLPYFYPNKVRPAAYSTFEHRLEWIRTVLKAARYHYPETHLIGMPWCEYIDLWRQRPDPDTEEAQVARRLSGWEWWRINETIVELADATLFWGGQGGTPFDPSAEFWDASKHLFEVYGGN